MKKETIILIDFEFTGLDNTFVKDNEIIQMKAMNIDNGLTICHSYNTTKRICAHAKLSHKTNKYYGTKFSQERFQHSIGLLDVPEGNKIKYYGFGVKTDSMMLYKYGVIISINDIREMLQLSKHENKLATEGSGLEACFLIATGRYPEIKNHDGIEELYCIRDLYFAAKRLKKKKHLTVMPHGHCAGMPLVNYVSNYRRAADGYRFNNCDNLAQALNATVEELEPQHEFEEDDL